MLSTSTVVHFSDTAFTWLQTHGVEVAITIAIAVVAFLVEHAIVEHVVRRIVRGGSEDEELLRENTLIRIIDRVVRFLIWLIAVLTVLSLLGIDIAPLLAAAGVAGVAIGFGAQYMIRDLLAGFFVIIENQYRVGDVVSLDATAGLVEDITMRMTTLRDLDGTVHHVTHGNVQRVSNLSKGFARVNLDISISYRDDLEKVIACVNRVGRELADDPEWKRQIIAAPHFERVENFAESAVIIKVLGETRPLQQWAVAGELRKRIKIAFDKEGIEIPFPQRTVHNVS